MIECENDMQ